MDFIFTFKFLGPFIAAFLFVTILRYFINNLKKVNPMSKESKPDFEALRKKRNEAVKKMVDEMAVTLAAKSEVDPSEVQHNFNFDACYCACPDGPCEHNFQGWVNHKDEDGHIIGGSTVCKRCGMDSMSHDMRVMP